MMSAISYLIRFSRSMAVLALSAVIVTGLLISTSPAVGGTFYVSPGGNDSNPGTIAAPWQTIRKAASTLVAGDTAIIMDGTYTEPEIQFKNSGTAALRITAQAENQHLAILASTSSCHPAISLYGGYITIDGLRLTVSPNDVNCTSGTTGNYHIHIWNSNEPVQGGNESSGYTNALIKNVQIDEANGHRFGGIKTRQDNTIIEHNVVWGSEGVEYFKTNNTIIRNNTVFASEKGIIAKAGARSTRIYNNIVHVTGSSTIGVSVGGCTGAPWFFDTDTKQENYNAAVYNNVILNDTANQGNRGFVFRSDSNSKVFNNVTVNMNPVSTMLSCTINTPLNTNVNPTFENNILIGNGATTVGPLTTFSGTKTVDYNNFYNFASGVPTQVHAITGNPNLVNNASDWHTQIGSPAIAVGTIVTMIGYDGATIVVNQTKDGVMRPAGSAWDLGIYQTHGVAGDTNPPSIPVNLRVQ